MGVRPYDPEVIPLTFDAIATRGVSLVNIFSCSIKYQVPSCPAPPLQGAIQTANRTKPLAGARYGALVNGQIVKWRLLDQAGLIWDCFQF